MSRIDRYKNRKKIKQSVTMQICANKELVDECLSSQVNEQNINSVYKTVEEHYDFKYDFNVSEDEARDFLVKFKKEFNGDKFDKLISNCKNEVIKSIVTPFGLGKVVAAYDKAGGNVDTIHNVRNKDFIDSDGTVYKNGVYATDEAKENYEQRGDYNSDEYHKDNNFIDINRKHSKLKEQGVAIDYMTGEQIRQDDKHDLDHIVSGKETHDDAGRVLADVNGAELANTEINLKPTDSSINRSKKADSMEKFLNRKNENIKKIEALKEKSTLTDKEQQELKKLEKLQTIDDEKAMKADKIARKEQTKKINKEYYTSRKFIQNTAVAGLNEGKKNGYAASTRLSYHRIFHSTF